MADGAGGHESGEVASAAIKAALEDIPPGLSASEMLAQVRLRLQATHAWLLDEAARRGPRVTIASTVAVLIARDGHFACLWAGDSRVYLLRDGTAAADHPRPQPRAGAGGCRRASAPDEAEGHPARQRHHPRGGGAEAEAFELDKVSGPMLPGDRFLLCSDGLFKAVDAPQVESLLGEPGEDPPSLRLIAAALARTASDNVTAVTVEAAGEAGRLS